MVFRGCFRVRSVSRRLKLLRPQTAMQEAATREEGAGVALRCTPRRGAPRALTKALACESLSSPASG